MKTKLNLFDRLFLIYCGFYDREDKDFVNRISYFFGISLAFICNIFAFVLIEVFIYDKKIKFLFIISCVFIGYFFQKIISSYLNKDFKIKTLCDIYKSKSPFQKNNYFTFGILIFIFCVIFICVVSIYIKKWLKG